MEMQQCLRAVASCPSTAASAVAQALCSGTATVGQAGTTLGNFHVTKRLLCSMHPELDQYNFHSSGSEQHRPRGGNPRNTLYDLT